MVFMQQIVIRSVFDFTGNSTVSVVTVPFFRNGIPFPMNKEFPSCMLTLAGAGSMRFRWNEQNRNREDFFSSVCSISGNKSGDLPFVVPLELIHSRVVYAVDVMHDTLTLTCSGGRMPGDGAVPMRTGDGVITVSRQVTPVITVADCVPVYLYDPVTGCFGVVHSGWKGTGIAAVAIKLAGECYGARAENFCVVIGPHIQRCCYTVNADRAAYFSEHFSPDCVVPLSGEKQDSEDSCTARYRLSLAAANISLLLDAGVPAGNILHCRDCTSCDLRFGSFRRQTAAFPDSIPLEERIRKFTAMAAFVR